MIAIIGAGMAGLACARRLADAGRSVAVFDKGRGLGGRSRRGARMSAVSTTALNTSPQGARAFEEYLKAAMADGQAAAWAEISDKKPRIVGTPGMTALVKPLAEGLDIHRSTEIERVTRAGAGWTAHTSGGDSFGPFNQLALTAPAPQVQRLLGDEAALFQELAHIRYAPCWTLMAAFETTLAADPVHRGDGALPWIARDSSKPERSDGFDTWVAQASPDWSWENLERDREEIAPDLLDLMQQTLGIDLPEFAYLSAHRWRYARVEQAVGKPCLFDAARGIGVAGDGLLGGRVEAAFDSGQALAEKFLGSGT